MLKTLMYLPLIFIALFFTGCSEKHHEKKVPVVDYKNEIKDVVYTTAEDRKGNEEDLKMDIYMPDSIKSGKKYPLFLFIHGGGYLTGDKSSAGNECELMADSGFIAVSINYRLGWDKEKGHCEGDPKQLDEAGYRTIQDANSALRFLISKAKKYAIDTSLIFIGGSSSGAITALHTVYITDDNAPEYFTEIVQKLGEPGKVDKISIKGICDISGALIDSNLINKNTAVPAIFFQGADDETVPVNVGHYASCDNYPLLFGSECLYRQLMANSVAAKIHILQGAGHGEEGASGFTNEFKMGNTAAFFHSLMQKNKNAAKP